MRQPSALATMWVGFALTAVATVYPFIDNATTRLLAGHIEASYPSYAAHEVNAAVSLYLVILSVFGVLGILSWLGGIWAAWSGKRWAVWAAVPVLLFAGCFAIAGLTVTDTSGDVGLAPALAWLQVLPVLAGVIAVAQLWRQRAR